MSLRFESEELDPATLEYLRTAARHEGDGMPGIYLNASTASLATAWLPLAGAIVGPILILITLFCTVGSVDDPINVAMLQTAGLFLGGWMFVAWMRSVIASKRPDYIGHFKLIDPLYIWHATGRGGFVTTLRGLDGAEINHTYDNQGNYSGAKVTLFLKKDKEVVEVKSEYLGERLEAFINVLTEFDAGLPAQRGYDALDESNRREAGDEDDAPPVRRLVESIPEPRKARSVFTWWRYPVVVVLFILTFLSSWTICSAMRDDEIFNLVTAPRPIGEPPPGPPDLRAYVVDRRNTRHRAEALQRLARFHDQAAQKIEARKNGDPQLTAGLASLVRALAHDPQPVISILVKQTQQPEDRAQNTFEPMMMQSLRKDLIKDLSEHLTPLVGPEIVAYGESESPPAMMEITSAAQAEAGGRGYRIDWTFTLQANPDTPKFVWKTQTKPTPGAANTFILLQQQYKEVKTRFEQALPR